MVGIDKRVVGTFLVPWEANIACKDAKRACICVICSGCSCIIMDLFPNDGKGVPTPTVYWANGGMERVVTIVDRG